MQPSECLKLFIYHFQTSFQDYPVNRKNTIDSLSLQIFSGLIIGSTILFPNHHIAFGMPQTAYPSFLDFLLGLSSQLEKHHRFPVFTNHQCTDNRQYYIIPKPLCSLWSTSNCLSIISGLLSRIIWSIEQTPQSPYLYKSSVD